MKYPKYLSIGNWLFKYLEPDSFTKSSRTVGGPLPENLYYVVSSYRAIDFSKDLRTYKSLIKCGCTEPDDTELLRLLK